MRRSFIIEITSVLINKAALYATKLTTEEGGMLRVENEGEYDL
ncbi:hypothetical protein ACE38V_10740 [Cytobacillus sp. Hz8]